VTAIERLVLEIAGALFLVWGTVLYLEHRGAAQCRASDMLAAAAQAARNEAQAHDDAKLVNSEAASYAQTLALPAPADSPHVSLCHYTPASVPQTAAARPRTDEPAADRTADTLAAAPDLGPALVKLGVNADAQMHGLQTYIREVCLR